MARNRERTSTPPADPQRSIPPEREAAAEASHPGARASAEQVGTSPVPSPETNR